MPLHTEVRHIMLTVTDGLGSQLLKVVVDDEGGSFPALGALSQ
jgi:hypothetical protein